MPTMSTLSQLTEVPRPPQSGSSSAPALMAIPYNGDFDAHAATMLPWLYDRLKQDGLLDLYFSTRKGASFCAFVRMMSGGSNIILATTQKEGIPDKVIGFMNWEPMNFGGAHSAKAGFIFLKEFWDGHTSTEAGKLLLTELFANTDIDVVIGNVAADNRLTSMFLTRLGWNKVGTIPKMQQYEGVECPANLWCITREEFLHEQR